MHPNDSRHLLPVNSMVFSRTTTDLASLQVHPHLSSANNNTNGYITARSAPALPHIPELSTYNITALPPPPPPAPPATSSPAKTQSEAATSPTRSAPQQPAWRMALSKFIKSFNAMRPRRGVKPSAENRPPLVIGHPTDFKHIETGGNEPLRTVQIANVPQHSN